MTGTATLLLAAGLPRPDGVTYLTSWTPDPAGLAVVLAAGVPYAFGARRLGGRWPRARSLSFACGLSLVVIATMSWFGVYAHTLFWAYAMQLILLLLVAPILLALGSPLSLAAAAAPRRVGQPVRRLLASGPARLLAYPILGTVLIAAVPFVVYFTGVYSASLRHYSWYEGLHVMLPVLGLVFAFALGEDDLTPVWFSYPFAVFVAFVELLVDAIPGIVLRLTSHVLAPGYYASVGRTWGPDPLGDQRIGGALWWFFGEALDLPVLVLLLVRWIRADRAEAERVDRSLDAATAGGVPSAGTTAGEAPPTGQLTRPWWETDASVFGERAGQYRRRPPEPRDPDSGD